MEIQTISVVLQIAALIFAVSVHESAHGWVAFQCGDPTAKDLGRISLNPARHIDPVGSIVLPALLAFAGAPVFGWAKPVPISLGRTRHPRSANLWISAAGPASNIILATVMGAAVLALRSQGNVVGGGSPAELAMLFGVYSVLINLILAVFNLLPIPPLDGFGVLESVVPPSWLAMTSQIRRWGMPILLLVIFSGALQFLLSPVQNFVRQILLG